MKTNRIFGMTMLLWLAAAAVVSAQGNAHLGRWHLLGAKSEFADGMGRETTLIYEAVGDQVKLTLDGVDQNAAENRGVWVGKLDGKFYPVKGNLLYDALSLQAANDHTNKIAVRKGQKVLWSGKSAVSRNGRTLTVTVGGKSPAGKKFKSKAIYKKQ